MISNQALSRGKRLLGRFLPARLRGLLRKAITPRFPSQEGAFQILRELGFQPTHCIDVGAYQGDWAKMFLSLFPEARVLMIEALESKQSFLQQVAAEKRSAYEIALLGATDGVEVPFTEMETGSSVYEEASPYARQRTLKKLVTLDTLLQRHPDFLSAQVLKLDTQGYELEVLKGCPALLGRVEVLLLEASLVEVNQGAPAFSDLIAFLAAHGFALFDFCSQIRRKDGILWQTDLMFIRKNGSITIPVKLGPENWG